MAQIYSQTVWQVMRGRTQDLFIANALFPCIISFLYGLYQFYHFGSSIDHYTRSYIPVIGSIIASVCLIAFSIKGSRLLLIPSRVFALYIFSILGIIGIASSTLPDFDVLGIVKGAVWTLLGWKMFRRIGKAADLSRTPIDLPNLKDHLISHVGLNRHDLRKLALDENMTARLGQWL